MLGIGPHSSLFLGLIAVLRIYVDAAYCYRPSSVVCLLVCLSVCRSVTLVSPAQTAEPIEIPLGSRTRMGFMNHVLDGVHMPHGKEQF